MESNSPSPERPETNGNKLSHTFIQQCLRTELIQQFQEIYDCFFGIFKERQSRIPQFQLNIKQNDDFAQNQLGGFTFDDRGSILNDFLYLPSYVTQYKRKELEKKFGAGVLNSVEKQFKRLSKKLSLAVEARLLGSNPQLSEYVGDIQSGIDPMERWARQSGMSYEYIKHKNFPEYYAAKQNLRSAVAEFKEKNPNSDLGLQMIAEQNELKKYKETLMKVHQMKAKMAAKVFPSKPEDLNKIKELQKQIVLLEYTVKKVQGDIQDEKKVQAALKAEMAEMRKNYFQELMSLKSKDQMAMRLENGQFIKASNEIVSVSLFDASSGLEPYVVNMLNAKLQEHMDLSDRRYATMVKQVEDLTFKNQNYQKLSAGQQQLIKMEIKDIVSAFPIICKDPAEVLFLFLQVYSENQLLPIISKQFGAKLGVDITAMQRKLQEVKEFAENKMGGLEKIHREVNVSLQLNVDEQRLAISKLETDLAVENKRQFQDAQKLGYELGYIEVIKKYYIQELEFKTKIEHLEKGQPSPPESEQLLKLKKQLEDQHKSHLEVDSRAAYLELLQIQYDQKLARLEIQLLESKEAVQNIKKTFFNQNQELAYALNSEKLKSDLIEAFKKKMYLLETERHHVDTLMKKEAPIAYRQMKQDVLMISEQAQADYQLSLSTKVINQVADSVQFTKTEQACQTNLMGVDLKFQVMKPGGPKDLMFNINQDRFFEARSAQTEGGLQADENQMNKLMEEKLKAQVDAIKNQLKAQYASEYAASQESIIQQDGQVNVQISPRKGRRKANTKNDVGVQTKKQKDGDMAVTKEVESFLAGMSRIKIRMEQTDPRDVFFLENQKLRKENKFKIDSGQALSLEQFKLYYKNVKEKPRLVEELYQKMPAPNLVRFQNQRIQDSSIIHRDPLTGNTFVNLVNLYDKDLKAAATKAKSRNQRESQTRSFQKAHLNQDYQIEGTADGPINIMKGELFQSGFPEPWRAKSQLRKRQLANSQIISNQDPVTTAVSREKFHRLSQDYVKILQNPSRRSQVATEMSQQQFDEKQKVLLFPNTENATPTSMSTNYRNSVVRKSYDSYFRSRPVTQANSKRRELMFISNNLTGDISSPDLCDQHQAELGAASNTDSYAPASHPLSHKFVET